MYICVYRVYLTCCTGLSVSGSILLTDFYCRRVVYMLCVYLHRLSADCMNVCHASVVEHRACFVPKWSSSSYCCCTLRVWLSGYVGSLLTTTFRIRPKTFIMLAFTITHLWLLWFWAIYVNYYYHHHHYTTTTLSEKMSRLIYDSKFIES